jgi:hypothetical protein
MWLRDYFWRRSGPNLWMLLTLGLSFLILRAYWSREAMARGGLSGGSTICLWYGVLGTTLMVVDFLLLPLHRCWTNRKVPNDEASAKDLGRHRSQNPERKRRLWARLPKPTRAFYLEAHVWLGLLSSLLIIYHSGPKTVYDRLGFRPDSVRLASVLLVVFLATNVFGIMGIMLQAFLPRLTRLASPEGPRGRVAGIPVGQFQYALDHWRDEANRLIDEIEAAGVSHFRKDQEGSILPLLEELTVWRPSRVLVWWRAKRALADMHDTAVEDRIQKKLDRLREIVDERQRLGNQELYYGALHAWLFAHIGLAVLSLMLVLPHMLLSLYY